MKLSDIAEKLSLEVLTGTDSPDSNVTGVYVSDLLSDVMAHSRDGDLWVTLQTHMNIVAVASLNNLSGIIIVGNREIPQDVLEKAAAKHVDIMRTPMFSYETAGKLYNMLNCRQC